MKLEAIISSSNVAKHLSADQLSKIGDRCAREYTIDDNSRNDWKTKIDTAMDLAMQVVEAKNYPFPNASNVKYPLMTVAAIQFAARAYPAIIPPGNIVNAKVLGNDGGVPLMENGQPVMGPEGGPQWQVKPGAKAKKAGRIARHMSWQLREEMEEWEEETDKLLHILPIVGCCFRKSWYDSNLGRNVSQLISPKHFVVNYSAKSLELAPRVTHEIKLYPHEIVERVRGGLFLDHDYGVQTGDPESDPDDEDAPHWFCEQHRRLDLDEDGYSEPYIVTFHKETRQVARIVPRFSENDIEMNGRKVTRIKPIQYFTKYSFMPSPDGGFYDVGFGTLLNPINHAVNTSLNQMLDAGHQQTAGGGFIGGGLRLKSGAVRLRPGEYKKVDIAGGTIRENIVDLKFAGPSPVLFQLLGLLIEAGKDISSVKDVMTGDAGPANEAATRTMARIEQGMKVFTAIYKRVYRALRAEYKKLFRLNALYLQKETYFTLLDEQEQVSPDDYDPSSLDVVPVADPNQVSDLQKMARAEFLGEFKDDPYFNPIEVRKRILEAGNFEDREELLVEQPPQDPKVMEAADKIEVSKRRAEIEAALAEAQIAELETRGILNIAKAEAAEAGPQIAQYKEEMAVIKEKVKSDAQAKQRAVSGVAGSKGNGAGS